MAKSKAPVVLFAGAGASAPIGFPTSKQIMNNMGLEPHDENKLRRITSLGDLLIKIHSKLSVKDNEAILDFLRLYNEKSNVGGNIPSNLGFDIVKERLKEYIGFDIDDPTKIDIDDPTKEKIFELFDNHLNDMRRLERNIKRSMHRFYGFTSQHSEGTQKIYEPLMDLLLREQIMGEIHELPIFTTNYDLVFDRLRRMNFMDFYDFRDGFKPDNETEDYIFDDREYTRRRQTKAPVIKLYKLHGSLNWANRIEDNRIVRLSTTSPLYDDPNYRAPLIIYPAGYGPYPRDEFHILHEHFEESLINASKCIVIGFSFRDIGRINHYIEDVMKYENKELEIIICGKKDKISKLNETKELFEKFPGRYTYFGGGIENLPEKLEDKYEKKKEKINKTSKEPI